MSWSVSAKGKPADVIEALEKQFSFPLAEGNAGLPDENEKETVRQVKATIIQCLGTFDPDQGCRVMASGHMGYSRGWDTKKGPYQNVSLSIGTATLDE